MHSRLVCRGANNLRWPRTRGPATDLHLSRWSGLRGALSLALALSLPLTTEGGEPFPERGFLLAMTFGMVGLSLLLQGLTMSPLLVALSLSGETSDVAEFDLGADLRTMAATEVKA